MSDNALGKGLDALIQKPKEKNNSTKEDVEETSSSKLSVNSTLLLSDDKIEEIKNEVEKNPRISLWSIKSAACLRYLKKTTPEFSISKEASNILENAISKEYPEIWKLFDDL